MVATNDTLEAAAGPSSLLGGAADLKLEPMEIDAVMPDKADLDCPTACCCNMIVRSFAHEARRRFRGICLTARPRATI